MQEVAPELLFVIPHGVARAAQIVAVDQTRLGLAEDLHRSAREDLLALSQLSRELAQTRSRIAGLTHDRQASVPLLRTHHRGEILDETQDLVVLEISLKHDVDERRHLFRMVER